MLEVLRHPGGLLPTDFRVFDWALFFEVPRRFHRLPKEPLRDKPAPEHRKNAELCHALFADWILDLGPEGGHRGGALVCAGPPEAIAQCEASHTGHFLREVL